MAGGRAILCLLLGVGVAGAALPVPEWICPCHAALWREYHDPAFRPSVVEANLVMPYSVAEFDEGRQTAFRESVADAVSVEPYRVTITSITAAAAAARRLLSQACEVSFRVQVPNDDEKDRAPPILAALSFERVNARLEQKGLQPALRFVGAARIVRPQRSCATASINGTHTQGPFPRSPPPSRGFCCWPVRPPQCLRAPAAAWLAGASRSMGIGTPRCAFAGCHVPVW